MTLTFHRDCRLAVRQALTDALIGNVDEAQWALEGRTFTSTLGTPWARETYKGGPERLATIPAKAGLVRFDGLYLLDLFFPDAKGIGATEAAVGAVRTIAFAGAALSSNGQVVHVLSASRAGSMATGGFLMTPLAIRFYAYDTNP